DEVFRPLLAGNWNVARARQIAEEFERIYFSKGFWSTEVKASLKGTEELYIHAKFGTQFLFDFRGNDSFSRAELMTAIMENIRSVGLTNLSDAIAEAITISYRRIGHYYAEISLRVVQSKDVKNVSRQEFFVNIKEGKKTKLTAVDLEGNQFFSDQDFLNVLNDECSILVCRGYYDETFFGQFTDVLRKKYLS